MLSLQMRPWVSFITKKVIVPLSHSAGRLPGAEPVTSTGVCAARTGTIL